MNILRALARDLLSPASRHEWLDSAVRGLPGEFGFALRTRIMGARFGHAGEGLVIYPGALILGSSMVRVGRNCRIGRDNVLQANGGLELGDDVLLGPGVKIWTVNHVFTRLDVPIWTQGYDHKPVVIGHGVWIGADCFVMPGARIGDHAVISAGSVVGGRDVEPYSIVAGNPARKVGSRNDRLPEQPPPTPPLPA